MIEGEIIPRNKAQAIEWYTKAANNGNLKAQYNLGITYLEDDDVPQDFEKAEKWKKKQLDKETIKHNLI